MTRRFSRLTRPAIRKLKPGERISEYGISAECLADGDYINALCARLVVAGLGARTLTGLVGDVAIPKMSTGVAAGFVAESGNVSEVNATFAQVTTSPKTLGVMTDVSRLLMHQADPSIEAVIREDLLNAIAVKSEDVAIEGGGSNEPTGITQTSGIGAVGKWYERRESNLEHGYRSRPRD
jgi:HK97 family phage major capsid protein